MQISLKKLFILVFIATSIAVCVQWSPLSAALMQAEPIYSTVLRSELPAKTQSTIHMHYLPLIPLARDMDVTIVLAYEPRENANLLEKINFHVLTADGMRRYRSGIPIESAELTRGTVDQYDVVGNSTRADFFASGLDAYTVIVDNRAEMLANYTLSVKGAILADYMQQTISVVNFPAEHVPQRIPTPTPQMVIKERTNLVTGVLDTNDSVNYWTVEPDFSGSEVEIHIEYHPMHEQAFRNNLNFFVLDEDGLRRHSHGTPPQFASFTKGLLIPFHAFDNELSAKFIAPSVEKHYTVVVDNDTPLTANYELSIMGGQFLIYEQVGNNLSQSASQSTSQSTVAPTAPSTATPTNQITATPQATATSTPSLTPTVTPTPFIEPSPTATPSPTVAPETSLADAANDDDSNDNFDKVDGQSTTIRTGRTLVEISAPLKRSALSTSAPRVTRQSTPITTLTPTLTPTLTTTPNPSMTPTPEPTVMIRFPTPTPTAFVPKALQALQLTPVNSKQIDPTPMPSVHLQQRVNVDQGGYSFRTLSNYQVVRSGTQVALQPVQDHNATFALPTFTFFGQTNNQTQSLDEIKATLLQSLKQRHMIVRTQFALDIDGVAGFNIQSVGRDSAGHSTVVRIVYVQNDTQAFSMSIQAPLAQWEARDLALFEAVLGSVQLFTPVTQ
ncbi:MAG: hypothetical protein AAF639_01115 [Chloroflexota bacterium]